MKIVWHELGARNMIWSIPFSPQGIFLSEVSMESILFLEDMGGFDAFFSHHPRRLRGPVRGPFEPKQDLLFHYGVVNFRV